MRAVFTQNFFSPQPTDTGTTSTSTMLASGSIRYDEQRHGPVEAFMQHADFAPFKECFVRLIDEVSVFAHDHAHRLTPPIDKPRLQAIARDFDTFKRHLFDVEQNFFSSHTYLMYSVGFDAFEQLGRLLQDERITLQRRMDTVINLAPDTTVCAGGCVTGLQNALGVLTNSGRGIVASAHRFKQQMVDHAALQYAHRHHRYHPGNEVHYANAYINFSADTLGVAARPDPFARTAEGEMTLDLLNEFAQSVHQSLCPMTMAQSMADDYVSRIKQIAQADADGSISIEQIAETRQRIEALQATTLDAEYGPIPLHDLLIEHPAGGCYQIIKPPTLVAVRLMDRLKKEKLIEYNPLVLAKAVDGEADLLYLDGLMWLNRKAEHEPLDMPTLCRVLPLEMLAALSRTEAIDKGTSLAIFCDIAEAVATSLQTEPPSPPPVGWLTNFVGVLRVVSGARHRELAIRLLNLSLRFDDGHALEALLETGLDKEVTSPQGWSLAAVAAARDCTNVLRALLRHAVDIEAGATDGTSPLMMAVRSSRITPVKMLLEAGARIDAASHEGRTALMIAAQRGDAKLVEALLQAGAKVNAVMRTGDAALILAAKNGHADTLRLLIAAGADLDTRGTGTFTALMSAAQGGHVSALLTLLQARAPIESRAEIDQHTALTLAALRGHVAAVETLLAAGAQVSARLARGHTALMLAATSGNNAIVKALILAGADTECKTVDDGRTALMLAVANGQEATVTLLLNAGADIDSRSLLGNTALMQAAMAGQHAVLTTLLAAGAPIESRATVSDYTALMQAAICNETASLRLLLDAGACIDAATGTGQTALTLAAHEDNSAAVEMLAARGAHTEYRTFRGLTPLMIMAQRGRIKALRVLLAAGASVQAIAPDGRSAHHMVQEAFEAHMREILRNAGALQDG